MGLAMRKDASSAEAESHPRLQLPVFTAAQRVWTVADVRAVAPLVLGDDVGSAPSARQPTSAPVDESAVDAAVQAFRYAHGLVSAQDCLAWLSARALSFADLRAGMRRRLLDSGAASVANAEIDIILSDDFRLVARAFAARVAAAAEVRACVDGPALQCWDALDAGFSAHLSETITNDARERLLAQDRRQWLRIEGEVVEFDRLDAAREARHCVIEDGQSLLEIAALGGFAHRTERWWVSDLPGSWRQALFQIRPGMVTEVIVDGERQLLLGFTRLIEPNLADPFLAARLEDVLVEQLVGALLTRHVHWMLAGLD